MTFKTKLEALYATRNHWHWLAITGSSDKRSYLPANNWPFVCACCLYAGADESLDYPEENRDCEECPLNGYAWGVLEEEDAEATSCTDGRWSYYRAWRESSLYELRRFYANRMVYACNLAIEAELLREDR